MVRLSIEMDFESVSFDAVAADMVEICLGATVAAKNSQSQPTSKQLDRRLIDEDDRLWYLDVAEPRAS